MPYCVDTAHPPLVVCCSKRVDHIVIFYAEPYEYLGDIIVISPCAQPSLPLSVPAVCTAKAVTALDIEVY